MLNTVLVEGYATLLRLTWSTERGFGCVTFCERQTTCTLKGFTVTRMKGLWWVETVQLVMMTPLIGCFTPFISPLFPFSFSNCSADAEKSESWSPSCTRKNVHQAANSGISLHNRINSHFSVVFHCGVLQQWRVTLAYIHLFFTAFLRRDCFDAAWSISP